MKIVVGGSYHKPNWDYVKKTIDDLVKVGHEVIAPGGEWEPINIDDEFVKFKGEEDIPIKVLQEEFNQKINYEADAFVVVNSNGYIGYTAATEILLAIGVNLSNINNLPIYFTEEPKILKIFNNGEEYLLDEKQGIVLRFVGPDEMREALEKEGVNITQEEYDILYSFHTAICSLLCDYPIDYKIGISDLINPKTKKKV